MIRYLNKEEKTEVRGMWESIFCEDSESFRDYYFHEKIKNTRVLAAWEDGGIVSMLHQNPYQVSVRGRRLEADYVGGVATRADKRHQGYMRRLLSHMLRGMLREKMGFCYLIPVDTKIYEPFGFAPISGYPKARPGGFAVRQLEREVCRDNAKECREAAKLMDSLLRMEYDVFCLRDENYVRSLIHEVESDGGKLQWLLKRSERGREPVGLYAFYGDEETVRDLVCRGEFMEKRTSDSWVMARIADLREFIKVICLEESAPFQTLEMILEVEDDILKENSGRFLWRLDRHGSELTPTAEERNDLAAVRMDIGNLASRLFGFASGGQFPADCHIRCLRGVHLTEIV